MNSPSSAARYAGLRGGAFSGGEYEQPKQEIDRKLAVVQPLEIVDLREAEALLRDVP